MEDHWLWPLQGGTWKERIIALGYLALLWGGLSALYLLAWALAPFF
jgi:hypothetical protein